MRCPLSVWRWRCAAPIGQPLQNWSTPTRGPRHRALSGSEGSRCRRQYLTGAAPACGCHHASLPRHALVQVRREAPPQFEARLAKCARAWAISAGQAVPSSPAAPCAHCKTRKVPGTEPNVLTDGTLVAAGGRREVEVVLKRRRRRASRRVDLGLHRGDASSRQGCKERAHVCQGVAKEVSRAQRGRRGVPGGKHGRGEGRGLAPARWQRLPTAAPRLWPDASWALCRERAAILGGDGCEWSASALRRPGSGVEDCARAFPSAVSATRIAAAGHTAKRRAGFQASSWAQDHWGPGMRSQGPGGVAAR